MDKMVSLFRKDRNVKVRKASLDRFQTFPTAILQCVFVCRSLFYILSGEERKREKRKEREREENLGGQKGEGVLFFPCLKHVQPF